MVGHWLSWSIYGAWKKILAIIHPLQYLVPHLGVRNCLYMNYLFLIAACLLIDGFSRLKHRGGLQLYMAIYHLAYWLVAKLANLSKECGVYNPRN